MRIPGPGKKQSWFIRHLDGTRDKRADPQLHGAGVIQGMHNLDASIESFARSCFTYALDTKQDLWFATKRYHFQKI